MRTMKKVVVLFALLASSTFAFAKSPPPPSLEDEGSSFINNAGDESQDLNPDGQSPEPTDDGVPPELAEPPPPKPQKPRIAAPPAAVKNGNCNIRIALKCNGELIKNRQVSLQMDGVGYAKETSATGELIQSFPCGGKPKGKKFLLKFFEFKTEISFEKVPTSIDIPKGQCL